MACPHCDDRPSSELSQGELMNLAAAIACGKMAEARDALNILFRDDARARDWIERARSLSAREDPVDRIAAAMARADGLDWSETCPYEGGDDTDGCDSSTCIAAYYEDHDPDVARESYRRYARVSLGLPVAARKIPAQPNLAETTHV